MCVQDRTEDSVRYLYLTLRVKFEKYLDNFKKIHSNFLNPCIE